MKKPTIDFTKDKYRKDGLSVHCRPCKSKLNGYKTQRDPKAPKYDEKAHSISYRKANLARYAAYAAKRKAQKLNATPKWFEKEEVEALYEEAKETGVTVDHIVPLQGERVSGLHCLDNLQLMEASENFRKNNRFS